jgi:phosphatidylserine decarboxylase
VGGDRDLAIQFQDGEFATLYLSPRDYHRIHMPCDGRLTRMIYIPGDLFSVNPTTARGVPGLFARNERVVCVFENDDGPFVLTLVGATIVGSMATVWHGQVNPPRPGTIKEWDYAPGEVVLKRATRWAASCSAPRWSCSSPRAPRFTPDWAPARPIRMGEAMGTRPLNRPPATANPHRPCARCR